MTTVFKAKLPELPNLDINLDKTVHPQSQPTDLLWSGDWLHWVGMTKWNCASFNVLATETARSLRDHIIKFAGEGKYAHITIMHAAHAIRLSLTQHPTRVFDEAWLLKALTIPSFQTNQGVIKSFFVYWQERYSKAVTSDALHLLAKRRSRQQSRNVLSDDPEKSWLTDIEYDALLQRVWEDYVNDITGTQATLLRLLSMQYARRPVQLANLKIGDFRDGPADGGSVSGRRIHFPGAKDRHAQENFRDSKEEVHPVADYLWDLFQIQKHKLKALFESTLDITLNEHDLEQLPVFTTAPQLTQAVDALTNYYGVDWKINLNSRLFHMNHIYLSRILAWSRITEMPGNTEGKAPTPPLSHRTGKPIVVTATRMRHTRARQLARLGMPKHVLSFWLGHTQEKTLEAYYNDPAEEARQINEAMGHALVPLAMSFTGKLLDDESQASRASDPESKLEFANDGSLKDVGNCGKHSFCATTSVPIPCYRCKHFEPLVYAQHDEVLNALLKRQADENAMIKIGGSRKLLTPIDFSRDIRAVRACIARCDARKAELDQNHD